jgi:hypothetical protein
MQEAGKSLDPKDVLTPEELAERLKVGISWVYEKGASGYLVDEGAKSRPPQWK